MPDDQSPSAAASDKLPPWSIRGIRLDVRTAVTNLADKERQTVGELLNRLLPRAIADYRKVGSAVLPVQQPSAVASVAPEAVRPTPEQIAPPLSFADVVEIAVRLSAATGKPPSRHVMATINRVLVAALDGMVSDKRNAPKQPHASDERGESVRQVESNAQ